MSTKGARLTALDTFHRNFDLSLPNRIHLPSLSYRSNFADKVVAFVREPIQGSGGVIEPTVGWLKDMRERCCNLGVSFVADEIITGFGPTAPYSRAKAKPSSRI